MLRANPEPGAPDAPVVPEAGADFPEDLLGTLGPLARRSRIAVAALLLVLGGAAGAYVWQLYRGLRATGLNDFVFWGVYMANFIFFIGISYAGTLISAVLRLTGAEWRRPITRIAEVITVVALLVGGGMIMIDVGRPDRLLHIPRFGRIQSPVLWDVMSITTYLAGSLLYLYVAMIPDLAILGRTAGPDGQPTWRTRAARILSLGFRATPSQMKQFEKAVAAMAIILIPVAVSAHSVVAWIFGTTLRPGWHSTIFAPYFVVGAIFSGTAALILCTAFLRRSYRLGRYLTVEHFRYLGWILLSLALLYAYFTFSEYLTSWYAGEQADSRLLHLLMGLSTYGIGFWATAILGLLLPIVLLILPGFSIGRLCVASGLVVAGMWIKRFLIVVPTLLTPFLPPEAAGLAPHYVPSLVEWLITAGGCAAFVLLFVGISKLVPIVSMWETGEVDAKGAALLHKMFAAPIDTIPRRARAEPLFRLVLLPVLAAGAACLVPRAALAQRSPASAPVVTVEREAEGRDVMLVATVMQDGKPVAGAAIAFYVRRTFGLMTLGEDVTLDDGSAAVAFPAGLVGKPDGTLDVVAEVKSPDALSGARGTATVSGGVAPPAARVRPRALWTPRGPIGMIGTIAVLMSIVWGTFLYVITRLVRMHQLAQQGAHAYARTALDVDVGGDGIVHRGLDVAGDPDGRGADGARAVGGA